MENSDCSLAFYVMFLTVYIIGFICIYKKNVELIGLGLLYTINIFASVFLINNLYTLSNNFFNVFLILCIVFIFIIVSFTLLMVSISRIYVNTKRKGSNEIILSNNNKKLVKKYKDFFVSSIVFIWAFLILFFLSGNTINVNTILDFSKNSYISVFFEIFKIILLAYPFIASIYLIILSNHLVLLTRSLI